MDDPEEPTAEELAEAVDGQRDALARLIGLRSPDDPYFEKIEVEVPTGRLVALDAAVMSAHLFVGIVLFKSLPKMFEEAVSKVEKSVGENITKGASFAVIKLVGTVVRLIITVGDTFNQEARARDLEQRIRKASAYIRKQLIAEALSQKRTVRKRRRVRSRHQSPPQRKANKSWQSPAPRMR